ncbi:anti-sigma factor [Microbacterium thalassium]|uniref:Regulator of SigK n=1 Tax=Microbacterium thalassium TaxID=362649 RepID=A0A7X0KT69_9MICO|nr:anti-sigma factor [Microbacterium thalassium]MBB6389806.1 anti-sigma-K factor RskA [Microbacterium thalassium]GLK24494.1 hypothetical protein GCM10017607_18120 [Microbacterium thalassium]
MNESEFAELAAGHALHALSESDERAFQTARAAHPEWEHLVRADAEVAEALADAAAPVEPPPAVRAALLARIAGAPSADHPADPTDSASATSAAQPTDRADRPAHRARRGLSRRGLFALAASIVLLLAIGAGAIVVTQQLVRPAAVVALEQIERAPDARSATATTADGSQVTVHWSDDLGQSVIVAEDFPVLTADSTFELWLVRDDTAISAGTFAADDSGDAVALLDAPQEPGDVIAVTVEQAGGSPTGRPTTEPIVAIAT